MKKALIIIAVFILAVFAVAVIANVPTFFTAVQGATSSIILSPNGGEAWFALKEAEATGELENASVLVLAFGPGDGRTVYAGTNGRGLFKSVDTGTTWNKIIDAGSALSERAVVTSIAFGPVIADPMREPVEVVYVAATQGNIGRVLRSTDGGSTFTEVYAAAQGNRNILFVTTDPTNPNTVWAGGEDGVLVRSRNAGEVWEKVQEFEGRELSGLTHSTVNPLELLLSTRSDGFFLSVDGGTGWRDLRRATQEFRGGSRIFSVAQDPSRPAVLYAGTGAGLLQSENFGRAWQAVGLTIPEEELPVLAVAVSPVARDVIYTTAGRNMYVSADRGRTWRVRHVAIRRAVTAVAPHPANPAFVLAGTHK